MYNIYEHVMTAPHSTTYWCGATAIVVLTYVYLGPQIDLGIAYTFKKWYYAGRLSDQDERNGDQAITAIDDPEDLYPDYAVVGVTPANAPRMAVHFASLARCELPLNEKTLANRLVAKKFLFDNMKLHGMRTSHISKVLPLALELSFVPSTYEVAAKRLAASQSVSERVESANAVSWRRDRPTIFNWFGRIKRETKLADH